MTYVIHGATGAQGGPLLARLTGSGQRAVAAVRNTVAAKGVPAGWYGWVGRVHEIPEGGDVSAGVIQDHVCERHITAYAAFRSKVEQREDQREGHAHDEPDLADSAE